MTQNNFTDTLKTKLDSLSNYTLPTSSTSTLGGVKVDGSTITINGSGVISSSGGSSAWTTSGSDIYRSSGQVGIGTTTPLTNVKVSIVGNSGATSNIAIRNTTATTTGFLYMQMNDDGKAYLLNSTNNPLIIGANNQGDHLYINNNGNIGIGTTNPNYTLQITDHGLGMGYNLGGTALFGYKSLGTTSYSQYKRGHEFLNANGDSMMCILHYGTDYTNPKVGIGTTSPTSALHVYSTGYSSDTGSRYQINASGGTSGSGGSGYLSLRVKGRSWFEDYTFHTSDSRIKKEIEDVPDKLALEQVRNIPCKYYKYVDTYEKGDNKTIGFIAQEVRSVLPMAVSIETSIIPNVYTNILDVTWEEITETNIETVTETNTETGVETNVEKSVETKKYKMRTSTLTNISGIKYKFYVSNTENDEVEKIITGNDDNTFTFEQQWTNVFCYGYEVEDFHVLDKNKLFALNFSATQELDRIQQQELTKVKDLEIENFLLKERVKDLESKMNDVLNRLAQLENN